MGALGSVPTFLVGVLAFPFAGYAMLFAAGSITRILAAVNRGTPLVMRTTAAEAILSGIAFCMGAGAVMIISIQIDKAGAEYKLGPPWGCIEFRGKNRRRHNSIIAANTD
jgi:hypothetical protein